MQHWHFLKSTGDMGNLRQGPNYSDQGEKKVLACKVVSKDLRGSWR